jgi:anti-sigma factor RsiW
MTPSDPHDQALRAALERLPRRQAPERLKRALAERWLEPRPLRLARVARSLLQVAAGAALAAGLLFGWQKHSASQGLFAEAVNDHLRLLYAEHPIEIESGGVHQVKPWFAGRVDFAPALGFGGDEEFPLQGGAVALFLDRKAAAFEFKRRLHPITLFVFRAEGLAFPSASRPIGSAQAAFSTERGFHVLAWRRADLGYALVSDLDEQELAALAAKLVAER